MFSISFRKTKRNKGLYIYYVINWGGGGSFCQNMTNDDIYLGGSPSKNMTIWQLGMVDKKTILFLVSKYSYQLLQKITL